MMDARSATRRIVGGFLITICAAGCASQNPGATTGSGNSAPGPAKTQATAAPSQAATGDESADAWARKTAAYTQAMEEAIAKRKTTMIAPPTSDWTKNASSASGAPSEPAHLSVEKPAEKAPSVVQWTDTNPFSLGEIREGGKSHGPEQELVPVTTPIAPAPAPAQVALMTKTPAAMEQFPQIAPEGREISPQPRQASQQQSMGISSDALQNRLETRVRDFPRDAAGQLDWQLFNFVQDRPTPDMVTLAGLPAEDRELVATIMDGLSNFRSTLRADSNMLLSRKVRPLLEMSDRIRSQADLSIPSVVLCKAVKGYGLYDPVDGEKIPQGRATQAILYCEVANFATQPDAKQMWQTRLSQEIALYSESDGQRIWHKAPEQIVDSCRNRRHDFYAYSFVQFPATLRSGRYVLKVTVVDQQSNRVAESTLPVAVVGQ